MLERKLKSYSVKQIPQPRPTIPLNTIKAHPISNSTAQIVLNHTYIHNLLLSRSVHIPWEINEKVEKCATSTHIWDAGATYNNLSDYRIDYQNRWLIFCQLRSGWITLSFHLYFEFFGAYSAKQKSVTAVLNLITTVDLLKTEQMKKEDVVISLGIFMIHLAADQFLHQSVGLQ